MIANNRDPNDGRQVAHFTQILGEWIDRDNRVGAASTFPIRLQFVSVCHRPLLDVAQSRAIDIAGDDATLEVHGSPRSRVMSMEVRHGVAAFIPVHIDRDSSEVADSRHARMLAPYSRPAQNYADLVPGAIAERPQVDCERSLKSTGEVVEDPALECTWTIKAASVDRNGQQAVTSPSGLPRKNVTKWEGPIRVRG